jgi:Right handed beta helix region
MKSALTLTSADNGETWQYYPADGVDTAIIDGGGTSVAAIAVQGGSNITINGLKLQNVVQYGIFNHGGTPDPREPYAQNVGSASGNIFKNNEITGISIRGLSEGSTPNSWESGCIYNSEVTPNTQVLNNYCHDVGSMGIVVGANSDLAASPGDFSGTIVSGNYVGNTCQLQNDCGALYAWNPNSTKSTNITIKNNFLKDYGLPGNLGHAIYLDYEASNCTISGNIISGSSNTAALLVSDGNNIVFTDNIFDVEDGSIVLLWYLNITGHQNGTGNSFTNNIVLVNATSFSTPTGVAGNAPFLTSANSGPLGNFHVQNNFYCNYSKIGSGPYNDTGNQFNDMSPALCNSDSGISGWNYNITASSAVFSSPVSFQPIAGGWGPPGFIVPQTGTAPSEPH